MQNNQLVMHLLPMLVSRAPELVSLDMVSCGYKNILDFSPHKNLIRVAIELRESFFNTLATMTPKLIELKLTNPHGLNKKRTPVFKFDDSRPRLPCADKLDLR